jgi:hypothetical protein
MNQERLMQGPLPMNRLALRVVLPASKEDLWQPRPRVTNDARFSRNALPIAPLPETKSHRHDIIGGRRGRMTIVGYAADQSVTNKHKVRWVVRCDCGNFEHRKQILRWLGTEAPDMCAECRKRAHKIGRNPWDSFTPARRATVDALKAKQS